MSSVTDSTGRVTTFEYTLYHEKIGDISNRFYWLLASSTGPQRTTTYTYNAEHEDAARKFSLSA